MDEKLGEINVFLEEINEMNEDLATKIDQRDVLIDNNNRDARKANEAIRI